MNTDRFLRLGQNNLSTSRREFDRDYSNGGNNLTTHDIEKVLDSHMNITLYVNQETGSNSNSGTSSKYPLASLGAAFDKIPTGGKGVINMLSDINIGTSRYGTGYNKDIYIQMNRRKLRNECKIVHAGGRDLNYYGNIVIGSGTGLRFYSGHGDCPDKMFYQPPLKDKNKGVHPGAKGMFTFTPRAPKGMYLGFMFRNRKSNDVLFHISASRFISVSEWSADRGATMNVAIYGHYTGKLVIDKSAGARIVDFQGMCGSYQTSLSGISFRDEKNNSLGIKDVTAGIKYDKNDIPVNVTWH